MIKRSKKDNIVALYLPYFNNGGVETATKILAEGYIERGFQVHIIVISPKNEKNYHINEKIKIHVLDARKYLSFFKFYRLISNIKPNLIISSQTPCNFDNFILCLFPRFNKIKRFLTIHISIQAQLKGFKSLVSKAFYSISSYGNCFIACVSNGLYDEIQALRCIKKESVKLIYNPLFNSMPTLPDSSFFRRPIDSPRNFIAIGRKRFSTILMFHVI